MLKPLLALFLATSLLASGPKPQRKVQAEVDFYEEAELEYLAEQAQSLEELEKKVRVQTDETAQRVEQRKEVLKSPENRKAIEEYYTKRKTADPYRDPEPEFPKLKLKAKLKEKAMAALAKYRAYVLCGVALTTGVPTIALATAHGINPLDPTAASHTQNTTLYTQPVSPQLRSFLEATNRAKQANYQHDKNDALLFYLEANAKEMSPRDMAEILTALNQNTARFGERRVNVQQALAGNDQYYALRVFLHAQATRISPQHAIELAEIHHDAASLRELYIENNAVQLTGDELVFIRNLIVPWVNYSSEETIAAVQAINRRIELRTPSTPARPANVGPRGKGFWPFN